MLLSQSPAVAGDLAAAAERLRASTVAVLVGGVGQPRGAGRGAGQGSGIVWRADGLVITNAHVARADRIALVLPDGTRVPARLVARDPGRDLAVLQAELPAGADALTPALRGDPGALRPGQLVLAFGHPLGLANALAVGVVHAAPSRAESSTRERPRRESSRTVWDRAGAALIRADVRLLPGNSGGPLADAGGRVVGVNTMIVGGLGVAVSVGEVDALLASGPLAPPVRYAA